MLTRCRHRFNPRAPCGARRAHGALDSGSRRFNPRAPCGARRDVMLPHPRAMSVSIHAPRVGRDCRHVLRHLRRNCFNPRAPCGARPTRKGRLYGRKWFQSTRPVWGATDGRDADIYGANGFNPRAPCGARRSLWDSVIWLQSFNPRAPCGARLCRTKVRASIPSFQSTRPVWGATSRHRRQTLLRWFQSTRPVWGATKGREIYKALQKVSIHAPRVGRDDALRYYVHTMLPFQSTRPVWGATATGVTTSPFCHVFMGIPLHKYDFLGT